MKACHRRDSASVDRGGSVVLGDWGRSAPELLSPGDTGSETFEASGALISATTHFRRTNPQGGALFDFVAPAPHLMSRR